MIGTVFWVVFLVAGILLMMFSSDKAVPQGECHPKTFTMNRHSYEIS